MSIEQIYRLLPPDYAQVLSNFDVPPQGLKVGIVVPSFRRARYPRRCLESLQNSDLSDSFTDYLVKNSAGGANFLFTKEIFRDVVRPALCSLSWDSDVVGSIQSKSGLIISTPRSLVQHIGVRGMWSKPSEYDLARDF